MKVPTKKLDESHLTDQEKRHSIALILMAMLLITTGMGASVLWKMPISPALGFVVILFIVGSAIIGFVWGYMGAMEDERSRGT